MNIPFRIKLLTPTAKAPERANEGDLWDLFADDFCIKNLQDLTSKDIDNEDGEFQTCYAGGNEEFCTASNINSESLQDALSDLILQREIPIAFNNNDGSVELHPQGRILVKTGIAIELPTFYRGADWVFGDIWNKIIPMAESDVENRKIAQNRLMSYAVADIRPRSGLALKHGITVLNTPGTIDNSYRKEIGVILYNAGHEPYTIKKGDKIAQMLIRPLYPSKIEIVKDFEDTGRGGFGSTGV